MNILGFISAFLIIFSIIFLSLFKQHQNSSQITSSIKGYIHAQQKMENSLEIANYKNEKSIKKNKTSAKNNNKDKNHYKKKIKDKSIKKIYQCSQINIFPLLEKGKEEEKVLYNIVLFFFEKFYPNENINFLNKILEKAKGKDKIEKIYFEDPKLQLFFYKILQGNKDKKCPSFLEFFKIDKNKNKICMQKADKKLLTFLFSKKIAEKIIFYRKKNMSIKKMLIKENVKKELLNLFTFSHKNHEKFPKIIIVNDKKSKVAIKNNFY